MDLNDFLANAESESDSNRHLTQGITALCFLRPKPFLHCLGFQLNLTQLHLTVYTVMNQISNISFLL